MVVWVGLSYWWVNYKFFKTRYNHIEFKVSIKQILDLAIVQPQLLCKLTILLCDTFSTVVLLFNLNTTLI
jgi:hypothetical protein